MAYAKGLHRPTTLHPTGPGEPLLIGDTAPLPTDASPLSSTAPPFTFDGTDDVTPADNTYANGFNKRVDVIGEAGADLGAKARRSEGRAEQARVDRRPTPHAPRPPHARQESARLQTITR
ncbi:hypothetical protein GCM10018793_58230 [Streptomyces sulfonofaciens]|uniref:Uncharacterized protein n=1 Tax=Streptomyces sulfonofaciens TaxID=68272 RepID=A0A919GLS8_9ACTN|nr:hypothetical protein [Streptomyces sulfonofaciens]GHH86418.1 hypothetical protein GCM10018793_58230 [Streptomyces sulfonofaciens]